MQTSNESPKSNGTTVHSVGKQNDSPKSNGYTVHSVGRSRGRTNWHQLLNARRRYIQNIKAAIAQDTKAEDFTNLPSAVEGSLGGGVRSSALTNASNRTADMLSLQYFSHPSSDFLAYHRRIEPANQFSHSPSYGF